MELSLLNIPVAKINQLKRKGLNSLEDLAEYYPKKYNDFNKITKIKNINDNLSGSEEMVCVCGKMVSLQHRLKKGKSLVIAEIDDGSGTIGVMWFNQEYLMKKLKKGQQYVVCGQTYYNGWNNYTIPSPVLCIEKELFVKKLYPVYSKVSGMSSEYLETCIRKAVSFILASDDEYEIFTEEERLILDIPTYKQSLIMIHSPSNFNDVEKANKRIITDTLYPFAEKMMIKKFTNVTTSPYRIREDDELENFIESLPFELTDGQYAAVLELSEQIKAGQRVEALIQGDVGCGKTIIATTLAEVMVKNGYQSAIMCPTTVLAKQHYEDIKAYVERHGIKVGLLTAALTTKQRKDLLREIANGDIGIVIGTHALISEEIKFKSLALIVVDEEHRFGVQQRQLLREKATEGVHYISMSATPIPRSIAAAVYGEETQIIDITMMPKGRRPVQTKISIEETDVFKEIAEQIGLGHQAYIVCPIIEDSDSLEGVESVETTFSHAKVWFKHYAPNAVVKMVNGNMSQSKIDEEIEAFETGKTDVLISTTIIEVGTNVPNATMMVIKNAERFGLSQLHQLRGRVGRGNAQSYCVMISSNERNPRLQTMVATNNGFEIAKKDLELRGTGDIVGIKQSGLDECLNLMLMYPDLYNQLCQIVCKKMESGEKNKNSDKL